MAELGKKLHPTSHPSCACQALALSSGHRASGEGAPAAKSPKQVKPIKNHPRDGFCLDIIMI
jgi:hypothetical protein